jgi:hypothetical protein
MNRIDTVAYSTKMVANKPLRYGADEPPVKETMDAKGSDTCRIVKRIPGGMYESCPFPARNATIEICF